MFLQVVDTMEEAIRKSDKCPPKIVMVGSLPSPTEIAIVGEQTKLLHCTGNLAALRSLLILYYILNVHYPKKCFNTFIYLQNKVLKVDDSVLLPKKVIIFINETE